MLIYGYIRHPAVFIGDFVFGNQLVSEEIDVIDTFGTIKWNLVDPSISMDAPLVIGKSQVADTTVDIQFTYPLEQLFMVSDQQTPSSQAGNSLA